VLKGTRLSFTQVIIDLAAYAGMLKNHPC